MNAILKSLENLGAQEKLQLVEDLWDSIDEGSVPVMTDEIYEELNRRAAWAATHPASGLTLDQLAQRLGVRL